LIPNDKESINFDEFELATKKKGNDPKDKHKGRLPDETYDVKEIYIQHFHPKPDPKFHHETNEPLRVFKGLIHGHKAKDIEKTPILTPE
jgi:hypothetical protein